MIGSSESIGSKDTELKAFTEKQNGWESERSQLRTEIEGLKAAQQTAADAIVKQLTEQNKKVRDNCSFACRARASAYLEKFVNMKLLEEQHYS